LKNIPSLEAATHFPTFCKHPHGPPSCPQRARFALLLFQVLSDMAPRLRNASLAAMPLSAGRAK